MRIGLFSDTFPPQINGVANSTYILYKELLKHGNDVYVITTGEGFSGFQWDDEHRVLRFSGTTLKWLYNYVMTSPWHGNAMGELKALDLDIIHAQTEFGIGIFARTVAKELGIPLVSTYHTTYEYYTHYVNFINAKWLDGLFKKGVTVLTKLYGESSVEVVAPSQKTKELLESYNVRREITVVPTGLELDRFDPKHYSEERTAEIRSEFQIPMDSKMVVYVGRIAEEKALDLVIRGFAKAIQNGTEIYFLVIGLGPDAERLKNLAEEFGVGKNIIFGGPKPNTVIPDIYRSADAFISASLSETQGMTFVEALASGLPLFARKDDVLEELLIEGKTGWYFQDENDLADLLDQFVSLSDDQLKMYKENAPIQAKPFSSEAFCNSMMEVYTRVTEKYDNHHMIKEISVKDSYVVLTVQSYSADDEKISVSLDDYYSFNLKKDGPISGEVLKKLKEREAVTVAYQKCLRRIAVRDRAAGELRKWLKQNTECNESEIESVLARLAENGYLDDERFARERVSSMKNALKGREKIFRDLKEKGIEENLINEVLDETEDQEEDNAAAYAKKYSRNRGKDSVNKLKNSLYTKLHQQGFNSEIVNKVLNRLDVSLQKENEEDNLRVCMEKAMRKYEKNYRGYELKTRVYRYCLQQGFRSEAISAVIDEMEFYE